MGAGVRPACPRAVHTEIQCASFRHAVVSRRADCLQGCGIHCAAFSGSFTTGRQWCRNPELP
eukprot:1931510-Pleurochrysis_carterae.AAC.3